MRKFLAGLAAGAVAVCAGYAIASRNAAGTMSAVNGPYVSGTTISSTAVNARLSDIETEITDSLSRSGKGGMTSALRVADGVVGTPSYSWTNDTGTGEYRIGAGDIGYAIAGVKKLELTSALFTVVPNVSFSGFVSSNLGLGAAATYPLDVQAQNGVTAARFLPSAGAIPLFIASNGSNASIASNAYNNGANWIYATTNPVTIMNFNSAGLITMNSAPSGTAGTAVTFTEQLRTSTGGVSIGGGTAISTFTKGTCGLNGLTPSTCTATVPAASTCLCAYNGTPAAALTCSVVSTTLTIQSSTASSSGVAYICTT